MVAVVVSGIVIMIVIVVIGECDCGIVARVVIVMIMEAGKKGR